jgi:Glycosyl transferases group 1
LPRIVYILIGTRGATGGHKIAIRHVEALVRFGLDAVAYIPKGEPEPNWFPHDAPLDMGGRLDRGDVLVIPEDALSVLKQLAFSPQRKLVFCQNHFYAAASGIGRLSPEEQANYREFIACGHTTAAWLSRFFPQASVEIIPAFADERRFKPEAKLDIIAFAPRKRQLEARAIQSMYNQLNPSDRIWKWQPLQSATEEMMGRTLGNASVFLSLNRLEGLGMTSLEAMRAGCVVAGFTGLGGREYATTANGIWVEEDDCEACAHALVKATRLVEAGGPGLRLVKEAAMNTASAFSYSQFLVALEKFWRAGAREAAS